MKTLTEFSTLTLRKAAEARAAAGGAPAPAAASPDSEAAADVAAAEADGGGDGGEAAAAAEGGEGNGEAAADGGEPNVAESAPATPESDPQVQALASALGVQPDRAARLIEALDIVGNRIDQVRLVRVFQGEKGPHNAISRGEFHYVVDRVAGPARGGRDRDDRRGGGGRDRGERRGGGGGGGGGGFGGDRGPAKPRGLGSLKVGAAKEEKKEDDRPGRGEMPRAGIGWQLTAAPRDFGGGEGRGRGGPRKGRGGPRGDRNDRGPRGPGGAGGEGRRDRGPRGPRHGGSQRPEGARGDNSPRLGPDGQPLPDQQQAREPRPPRPPREPRPPQQPRLGPDGQPLPPRPKRERKPIGPDANGLGPDGTPWDPERRAKRQAERDAQRAPQGDAPPANLNTDTAPAVEADAAKE